MTAQANEDGKIIFTEGKETRKCIILSLVFCAVFTAYHAMQNLQSSLNEDKGLGIISLSVVYGCFILSGILAPTAIRFLSVKGCIIVSWVIHSVYIASNFYPSFYTLIPSSALLGSISGFLWTSQSTYISTCSYSLAKSTSESPFTVLSRLNGLFFTIFETTQIPGNLVSSLVLLRKTNSSTSAGNCGPNYCPNASNGSEIAKPEDSVIYTLLGVFLAFDIITLGATILFVSPMPKSQWIKSQNLKDSLSSFFRTFFTSKLLFLVPFIMYQAVEQAFLWGDYTRSYISCPFGIQMVGFVMATYGAATGVSAFCFSKLAKYLTRYILFGLAAILHAGVFVVLYFWTPTKEDTVLIFIVPLALAAGEGIWQTQSNSLIAVLFPDKQEPAFANLHTWRALGFTVAFATGNFLCVKTKLIIVLVFLLLGMTLYACVEIYSKVKEKNKANIPEPREMK